MADSTSSSGTPMKTQPDRLKQFLLVLYLILPQIIMWAMSYTSNNNSNNNDSLNGIILLSKWYDVTISNMENVLESKVFWFCVFLLSIERIVYTFVWMLPKKFLSFCYQPWLSFVFSNNERAPVKMIEKLFYFNKFTQALSYTLFYFFYSRKNLNLIDWMSFTFLEEEIIVIITNVTLWQIITCLQLLILGLLLNFSIYNAIGKVGVYYGCKFGYNVPWCHSFPFNVIGAHPQYIGSLLNVFALQFILANNDYLIYNGWLLLGMAQVILYAYMGIVEQYF